MNIKYYDKLGEYSGKKIKITTDDGKIFEGVGEYYTSRLDNPDGIASICVGDFELYENEIVGIEVIPAKKSMPPLAHAV